MTVAIETFKRVMLGVSKESPHAGEFRQDDARDTLRAIDADLDPVAVRLQTSEILAGLKDALLTGGKLVMLKDKAALVKAFATENTMTEEDAEQQIDANQGRGFTAKNGTVYVLGGAAESDHDAVHETVHLMSASGGLTKILAEYGEQLNEAFTEYFTKQMCADLGVQDAVSYPDHVAWMRMIAPVVGEPLLYRAYMQDQGLAGVVEKLATVWMSKTTCANPYKPKATKELCVAAIDAKLKTGFPPTGPQLNFWTKGPLA